MSGISHLCLGIAQDSLFTLPFGSEESTNTTFIDGDNDSETAEITSFWLDTRKSLASAFFSDKANIETISKCCKFLVNPRTNESLNKAI